jgi:16S rRNA A1518/A1519 N6-dimethyltransferase RsmA/KsgA/DIM1 with predicted DNA glycosylase/AP lyase activity
MLEIEFYKEQVSVEFFASMMHLVKKAFNQRRKMLRNALSGYFEENGFDISKINSEDDKQQFENFLTKRAEQLSLADFRFLHRLIIEEKENNY